MLEMTMAVKERVYKLTNSADVIGLFLQLS
jgi:hypothetical protein